MNQLGLCQKSVGCPVTDIDRAVETLRRMSLDPALLSFECDAIAAVLAELEQSRHSFDFWQGQAIEQKRRAEQAEARVERLQQALDDLATVAWGRRVHAVVSDGPIGSPTVLKEEK